MRRSILLSGVIVGVLAVAAIAFALPWLPAPRAVPAQLERYAPLRNHDASLNLTTDAQGKPLYWTGRTFEIIPTSRALAGELPPQTRDALQKYMRRAGENEIDLDTAAVRLQPAQIVRQTDHVLNADGTVVETVYYVLRDARGDAVLGAAFPAQNFEFVFDPPALHLPASFDVNTAWERAGKAGTLEYTWNGRVVTHGANDCFTIETISKLVSEARSQQDYCAGRGVVAARSYDAQGKMMEQTRVFTRDHPLAADALEQFPLPASLLGSPPLDANFETWTLTRLGRVGVNVSAGEATMAPIVLPTNPPRVLASGYLGALFAYDADASAASALWSFPLGGTVYGAPAYDETRGRVYFGASDKHLYALDARGLFLWSFAAGDNIAARPLLVNDRVIFGSEDRHVYAVNADTGELEWKIEAASPIVSSAAFANGNVIVGSDDGTVYALDAETGATRWTFGADDAVQVPIVAEKNIAYAASRGGTLYALDAANGSELWNGDAHAALLYAPVVDAERVYAVNYNGELVAFDAATGHELARITRTSFIGTPLVVKDSLIVAGSDGNVYRLDRAGKVQQTWAAAQVVNAGTRFLQNPAWGADAVWLVDDRAGLWRLGTPRAQLAQLKLAWHASIAEPPFQQLGVTTSLAAYEERAVALDSGANVYVLNPATGAPQRVGKIETVNGTTAHIDPVIADDVLYASIGKNLYAFDLRGGRTLWRAEGNDVAYRPVVVADDLVLWLQLKFDENNARVQGTLNALDRATGATRWQVALQGNGYPTGVTVRDGIVYTAEPAAYDLKTGALRWRAKIDAWTLGGPALNDAGDMLYVAASVQENGMLVALDARDGKILWQKSSATSTPSFVERVWAVGDVVLVAGLSDTIGAVDAKTGAARWTYKPTAPLLGTLSVQQNLIWFMLQDGRVLALEPQTGKLGAQFADLTVSLSGVAQHPLVMGSYVLVPYETNVLGLTR